MAGVPDSNVFKFVALRPPAPPERREEQLGFVKDARPARETPVGVLVGQFAADGSNVAALVTRFIADRRLDLAFPQSAGDERLFAVESAVKAVAPAQISTAQLATAAAGALGQPVPAFVASAEARVQRDALWDHYHAFLLLSLGSPQNLEQLTRNLRIHHLLALLAAGVTIGDTATLRKLLSATVVVDPLFANVPRPKPAGEPPQADQGPSEATVESYRQLWSELVDAHRALEEVRLLPLRTQVKTATRDATPPAAGAEPAARSRVTTASTSTRVDASSFAALNPATKRILASARASEADFSKPQAVEALHARIQRLSATMAGMRDPKLLDHMPPQAMEYAGVAALAIRYQDAITAVPLHPNFPHLPGGNVRGSIRPLGIGDLKVVKQKLVKYGAGEVAHIENVLRGEYKERKHRVLDRTEEALTVATETEEETTKDTQTTERFELKKESEKTIEEQMSVQAGVTVSGSYGMVTFGAHGDFAYSTSTQESSKSASNFAREVIDKSVSRIQKKMKEERVTKRLHEVEEIATHGIDNKGRPDHAIGIYRWVDKYCQAQIYNYGKRMMFEFIVPEPAAFIEYAQTRQPKKDIAAPVPLPAGLTHQDITEHNYQIYIRDYQVQGCTPPPPEYKVVTATIATEAKIENGTSLAKSSKELVVPEGYTVEAVGYSLSCMYENHPQVKFSIADDAAWWSWSNNTAKRRLDAAYDPQADWTGYDGIVPFSINCYDLNSFFINASVTCRRRDDKYESWQIATFEKIVTGYNALRTAYEQKIAQRETQQGIVIHGQNPRINREIEKTELKKACVKLLLDTWTFGSYDAMKQTGDDPPDFDIFDAVDEGKPIQFFEQAFEWENITYLFYPYFWGRQSQWIHKATTFDADPLFTKFLQAGSARVVIPVHTAYNDAVMYFLENNGAIWGGGEPPHLDDPLFISLADELRDQTDDLGNATPDGEPWEVVLPTTLVYLQDNADLPEFP